MLQNYSHLGNEHILFVSYRCSTGSAFPSYEVIAFHRLTPHEPDINVRRQTDIYTQTLIHRHTQSHPTTHTHTHTHTNTHRDIINRTFTGEPDMPYQADTGWTFSHVLWHFIKHLDNLERNYKPSHKKSFSLF